MVSSAEERWTCLQEDGAAAEAALDSYEDAFERLRGVLGGDAAPGDVVSFFLNKEDANLTLFNYVRELKEELEKLSEVCELICRPAWLPGQPEECLSSAAPSAAQVV